MLTLSKKQARKLIVMSNDFHNSKKLKSTRATLKAIRSLGYVQLDTISVVNRAHLHVLWSRNHHFTESHLNKLFDDKHIFEYWSHAAAMLPMRDYRYSLIRKVLFASGKKHWHKQNPEIMRLVKQVISQEGPKKSSDFKNKKTRNSGWWNWKPTKIALEQLYMQGDLMVLKRENFHKIYELTEKVLPKELNTSLPTSEELCHHLIVRYLYAQGIGNAENIAYLRPGLKPDVQKYLNKMRDKGLLEKVAVDNEVYFALTDRLALLKNRMLKKVHILSPFDNMDIQRKRLKGLFDFDFQIECYVPAEKRKFGYFCLPILFGNELVGRADIKAHRKERILKINAIFREKFIKDDEKFNSELQHALRDFARFNQCDEIIFK